MLRRILSDPIWQGIGGIVAIVALLLTVYTARKDFFPSQTPIDQSPQNQQASKELFPSQTPANPSPQGPPTTIANTPTLPTNTLLLSTALQVSTDPDGMLSYDKRQLAAAVEQGLIVAFTNPAPLKHSWVLVEPGKEQDVADAAAARGGLATGVNGVLVASSVLNPAGETTFSIPPLPSGSYPYICTVPGHYAAGMFGVLTIP